MGDRIGQQLGNYRLVRLLGQGGFAEVYLGEHIVLGTHVAIKLLHTRVTQEDVAQFQQEARLLASLRHPHIIRIFDFGLDEQTPYLVMDYAPNGTLRTRYKRGTQLPISTVVDYIKQLAQALQYAHDRKIVHRDIKPENMLIGEYNEILLSDFGIALIAHSSHYQSTKDMAGTITYMAPEQIAAHPRPASDQYALGVVAYEWLSGTVPFRGSYTEIAIKHSVTPPSPLRTHLPMLSSDVEHVVLTALAKQPEERFASVTAFATALEQARQDTLPTEWSRPTRPVSPTPVYTPLQPSSYDSSLPSTIVAPSSSEPVPIIQTAQNISPKVKTADRSTKPAISRRAVLIGAVSMTIAVGAGVFVLSHQQPSQDQIPFTYRGHSNVVNAVAWSPNSNYIASGSADNTVQVWNASDGSNVFIYQGHFSYVNAVAWSPDSKRIASGSGDNTVQVWNASDGSNSFTYTGHSGSVDAVAWSPDGKRIASGSDDNTVQVWNASDGSHLFTYKGHSNVVSAVAWSPNSNYIASSSSDNTVQVWNISDGINVFTYKEHSNVVNAVVWSPDGKRITSGSADNTVQVWNASDGSHVFTYKGHSNSVETVAWSPDGKRIASGSADNTVQVWNASDGSHVFTYQGHSNYVFAVAWSPDGKRIASGSADNTVQVWQVVEL